jgi:hypothetical protein
MYCIVELMHLRAARSKLAFVSRIDISVRIVCVVLVKMHFAMQQFVVNSLDKQVRHQRQNIKYVISNRSFTRNDTM